MSTIQTTSPLGPTTLEYAAVNDPAVVDREFRYWRKRILITAIIGYALYYFVRANDSVPVTDMQKSLGFTEGAARLHLQRRRRDATASRNSSTASSVTTPTRATSWPSACLSARS
jgi:hypothetical protein